MQIVSGREASAMVERLAARGARFTGLEPRVRRIVNDVRRGGERSLRRYAERWDGLAAKQSLRVSEEEMAAAWQTLAPKLRKSLRQAAQNIRRFCEWQKPTDWMRTRGGIALGQIVRPLDSVGCYVPGGRYPLVSTVLMTVIPAQVAGVKNIRVVSPKPSAEVLAAAAMLRVREFYRVGGAQAVAALAYGTSSILRVDKIVGPGNAYVTAAKKLVAFDCAIDFLAGPTEAVILYNSLSDSLSDSSVPEFLAADLVAQAEHDPETLAVFITTSRELARAVRTTVGQFAKNNPIARKSLLARGAVLVAASRKQARDWANQLAPEHITTAEEDLPFIQNAGSVFIGDYSAQAAGDYASGPNHVLPTSGQARFRGGLSVMDFVKVITVQQLSAGGLKRIAPAIECLAEAEGLAAHAWSIRVRREHA
ncbi:MAG TPA: histidinol dehydrogenase [Candidatus Sulfotelmatobacter sp.]|nr:histidinol dehydrogenase [Candidatus Sulfotelmatobacter sp.]